MTYVRSLILLALAGTRLSSAADPIDDFLSAEMKSRRIPGAALAVVREGELIKSGAYGFANLELAVPVRPDTVFEIGSVTKQLTAAGIMLLVQDGRLSVDDHISQHLKETPTHWERVTIRHLLTHTSGIKSYTGLSGFEFTRRLTQRQFIEAIGTHPLQFSPGEKWVYSNTGYNLLGFIIENVSGKSFWQFMADRIFTPLEMSSTTSRDPSLIVTNRASGYEQKSGRHINRDYDLTDVFSAGAIVSTVGDLARWSLALDGDKLLSAATKQAMWTESKLNSGVGTGYGFGWHVATVDGEKVIGHGGSTSGFSASIQKFPDRRLAVILLTNTDEQVATALARSIARLLERTN